jgi:hypothetical protein
MIWNALLGRSLDVLNSSKTGVHSRIEESGRQLFRHIDFCVVHVINAMYNECTPKCVQNGHALMNHVLSVARIGSTPEEFV